MLLNSSSLGSINRNFNKLILDESFKVKSFYELIAQVVKSTGASEAWEMLANLATMNEWVGDRTFEALKMHEFIITNKDWQASVQVHKNHVEDDKLGLVAGSIRMLAYSMPAHYDKMIADLLNNGFAAASLSYDGKVFFATDHASGSNKGTVALSATNYETAVEAMMNQIGDDEQPLNIFPTHLVCGVAKRTAARTILKAEKLATGADNLNFGEVELIVSPRITGNQWFLADASKPIKGLILQQRSATPARWIVEPGQKTPEGVYGLDGRYNAGYGLHQLCYGSTG